MPAYLVTEPCIHPHPDGGVVHHRKPGAVVELSDEVAASLGGAVKPLGAQPSAGPNAGEVADSVSAQATPEFSAPPETAESPADQAAESRRRSRARSATPAEDGSGG